MHPGMKHELSRLKIAVMDEDEPLVAVEAETEMGGVGRVIEVTRGEAAVTVGAVSASKAVSTRSVSCRSEPPAVPLSVGPHAEEQKRQAKG